MESKERDFYIEGIKECIEQCQDTDLLELVFGLLVASAEETPKPSTPCRVLEIPQERRWAA